MAQYSIVSMSVLCTVSEIFNVEYCRALDIWIRAVEC